MLYTIIKIDICCKDTIFFFIVKVFFKKKLSIPLFFWDREPDSIVLRSYLVRFLTLMDGFSGSLKSTIRNR